MSHKCKLYIYDSFLTTHSRLSESSKQLGVRSIKSGFTDLILILHIGPIPTPRVGSRVRDKRAELCGKSSIQFNFFILTSMCANYVTSVSSAPVDTLLKSHGANTTRRAVHYLNRFCSYLQYMQTIQYILCIWYM